MRQIRKTQKKHSRGLSSIETLVVVAIIGLLAAVAVPLVNDLRSGSRQTTLDSGINTLNSAVMAYLTNGGEIPADADIADVIAKLKTVRKIEEGDTTVVAFGGSFIDQRTQVTRDSTHEHGIRWNSGKNASKWIPPTTDIN